MQQQHQQQPSNGGNKGDIFIKDLLSRTSAPVICFKFSSETCGPCKQIAPFFKELSHKHARTITAFEIDITQYPFLATYANIESVPTFVLYTTMYDNSGNQGQIYQLAKIIGANQSQLENTFNEISAYYTSSSSSIANAIPGVPTAPTAPTMSPPSYSSLSSTKKELQQLRDTCVQMISTIDNIIQKL